MKRLLSIILCTSLLTACGSDEQTYPAEMTSPESTASVSITTPEHTIPAETALPTSPTEDTTESEQWQTAYIDYLEKMWEDKEPYINFGYSLIYLDDDDIPELFINTGGEAGGEIVVTYHNGQAVDLHLSRIGTTYIQRSGLLYTNTGHMGQYPVTITKLENGVFSTVAEGKETQVLNVTYDENGMPRCNYEYDENGDPIIRYKYEWNGEAVSEEEFDSNIDELYDREIDIRPERWYSLEEMFSVLRTGKHTSAGHRYELIIADVTWHEAQNLCLENGGYLATITTLDEQDAIVAQIKAENMQDTQFFVGWRGYEKIGNDWLNERWINSDGSFTYAFERGFSEYYAPDYDDRKNEWEDWNRNDIDCKCGLVRYYDEEDRIFLFEAPDDILKLSPEYKGKLGYICEFD